MNKNKINKKDLFKIIEILKNNVYNKKDLEFIKTTLKNQKNLNKINKDYLILLEGYNSLIEAIKNNVEILYIFILKEYIERDETLNIINLILNKSKINNNLNSYNNFNYDIFNKIKNESFFDFNKFYFVNSNILSKLSTTKTPYPVISIAKLPEKFKHTFDFKIELNIKKQSNDKSRFNYFILLENIQDPGNLGTIIRTSVAFNFNNIILLGNTVSPFSSKVIRSSAGIIFHLENLLKMDYDKLEVLKENGIKFIGLSSHSDKKISCINPDQSLCFCFGNEGKGISKQLKKYIDFNVKIPISDKVESLNLGVSVALLEYSLFNLCTK